jgi:hypothetical protein
MKTHATNEQDNATFEVAGGCAPGLHLTSQSQRTQLEERKASGHGRVSKSNPVLKKFQAGFC